MSHRNLIGQGEAEAKHLGRVKARRRTGNSQLKESHRLSRLTRKRRRKEK